MLRKLFARFGWALMPVADARTLHWMARRYADGRETFSAWNFNKVTRPLLAAGVVRQPSEHPDETVWARHGSGNRECDGLTEEEAALGSDWINRNLRFKQQTMGKT